MDCFYQELANHHPNANQPSLPVEILELIVDDLASEAHTQRSSRKALRALALVSIALCRRAYKYLFSELSLTLADNISDDHGLCSSTLNQVISRLYNLLFQSLQFPGMGMVYYIRAVQISMVFGQDVQILKNLVSLPEFSGIMDCLHGPEHGITYLRLDIDLTHSTQRIKFPIHISKRANPRFYNAFISLCSAPKFTTLHLKNIALDSKSLCETNIQNLHLNNFSIEDPKDGHQYTSHRHKAVLQPISLSLLNIDSPKPNSAVPADILTDLVSFLHPASDTIIDQALARTHVFGKLTHLTLQDRDRTTPVHLLPRLRTLKILQTIYLTRRHMSYTTALPQFFVPLPGTGTTRDLGSVEDLIVETLIPDSRLFFCPEDEDEPRLEDAWGAVDTHLANALVSASASSSTRLGHVHFTFFLRTNQLYRTNQFSPIVSAAGWDTTSSDISVGVTAISDSTMEPLSISKFMADKEKFMTKFFPRLSSSEMAPVFSSDASFQRVKDGVFGVKCKGNELGWW